MPILPVLDLMQGQIVRGIAGRRAEYRPIVSTLVNSADPSAVANAFRAQFGFEEFYLADLDAIQGRAPTEAVYEELGLKEGFRLWVDAGISSALCPNFPALTVRRVARIVVGLETVLGPEALAQILRCIDPQRVVFSLDLQAGRPLGFSAAWRTDDAWAIATTAIDLGIESLIVLDLANVGVGEGVSTEALCVRIKRAYSRVQLIAGGGVRGIDDVKRLTDLGVDRVLVASALHDGRITPEQVREGK